MLDYINHIYYFDNGKSVKLKIGESKTLEILLLNKGKAMPYKNIKRDKKQLKKEIQALRNKTKIKIHTILNYGYVII